MRNYKYILGFILITLFLSCQNNVKKEPAVKEVSLVDQMEQIVKLHESQKWAEVVQHEAVLLKQSGKDINCFILLSDSYGQLGNYEKAIFYAEKILEKEPSNYYAFLMLGNYYQLLKSYDVAENFYLKVLEIRPTYARANLNLAQLYVQQNKKKLAITQYLQAIELFSANDFKPEVIQYSKEVLKLDPKNQKAMQYLNEASTPPLFEQ